MECRKCMKIIYIGMTTNRLKNRFYGHHYDNHIRDDDKLVAHFFADDHDWGRDLNVICIEQVQGDDTMLSVRERFWINKLEEQNKKW
jgi:hypothetical protein